MRKGMNRTSPEVALDRVLAGLEKELVDATDEEIELAAQDLGMNVKMKGSAAFIGVIYAFPKRIEDIFDLEQLRKAYVESRRSRRSYLPKAGKKDRGDDEK
jgi:hypothetical protein